MNTKTVAELSKKLGMARMGLLQESPFFGILLMHMQYYLDESSRTAATDGEKIFFAPSFLARLTLSETKFILLHEIFHIVLEHCFRQRKRSGDRFNIACDIVVNDTIKDQTPYAPPDNVIAGMEILSGAPDGRSGSQCSAEEIYAMIPEDRAHNGGNKDSSKDGKPVGKPGKSGRKGMMEQADNLESSRQAGKSRILDNHDFWQAELQSLNPLCSEVLREKWRSRIIQAALAAESRSAGNLPLLAKRALAEMRKSRMNWRRILYNFMRQEIFDYTFEQPDRRYNSLECVLPGWNDTRPHMRIWVAVDASGSMSDRQIADVLSEIEEIIRIFRLEMLVSYFDVTITEPVVLSGKNFAGIQPMGGGGTSFDCIFNLLTTMCPMPDILIIMSDGYTEFPDKKAARGIPVLWMINNMDVEIPWGHVARLP